MDFIETRARIEAGDLALAADLLSSLNSACRKAFSRSIAGNVKPLGLTAAWALGAGVYSGCGFTSHQEGMVARKASGLRKAANAKSKYLAGNHAEMAKACEAKIERKRADLASLKDQIAKAQQSRMRPQALAAKRRKAKLAQLSIDKMHGRLQKLQASAAMHAKLSKSGTASVCFGSRKLASQRHGIGREDSPFAGGMIGRPPGQRPANRPGSSRETRRPRRQTGRPNSIPRRGS